ncbi:putative RNA transcription, translation and transport factor protein [Monocercomonoides exilis]|uniref:putative RNA transcription, translation and transport factor protein n=1 Tax=Monocercomonoides exilis TaxID=2049356 RepID=UPI00355A4924|nr:putative RNA transcription, translation and transport factor protein [Monocercomonoides exilis]|eukprot:MONOS_8803.1-p1 / transcript=MONOS_8803.1 / gene=MONOS_8803 / organism=Monocercomonoides_exilis_PA203 / gene_product=unspecified product / transcript_product=unspecified product / location=Mono_scaffold00342:50437-51440(+) / protein_length=268 / sequence_SO=supercontig / SO=protein_coding / is_pseudo=false
MLFEIVTWLERTYLFQLEKSPLPTFFDNVASWKKESLEAYLDVSGFQMDEKTTNISILLHLTSLAINEEYKKNKDKFNSVVEKIGPSDESVPVPTHPELIDCVNRLGSVLSVPQLPQSATENDIIAHLEACNEKIKAVYESSSELSASSSSSPSADKSHISPLGAFAKDVSPASQKSAAKAVRETIQLFESLRSGDLSLGINLASNSDKKGKGTEQKGKECAEAVAVLRMLYLKELTETQTAINNALSQLQEMTANPKTDISLGKVGK